MSLNATLDPAIKTADFTAVDAMLHIVDTSGGAIAITAPSGANKRVLICDISAGSGNALTLNAVSVRGGGDPSASGIGLYEASNAGGSWVATTQVYLNPVTRAVLGRQLGLSTAYVPSGIGGGASGSIRTAMIYWPSYASGSSALTTQIPTYISHVAIAFARPDCTFDKNSPALWAGGGNGGSPGIDAGTGLQFWNNSAPALKADIASLKAARPSVKILLSIGGATYDHWSGLASAGASATAASVPTAGTTIQYLYDLANYLGIDGIDIDYEVANASGTNVQTTGELTTYQGILKGCRAIVDALGGAAAGKVLSLSALHVGFDTSSSFWWTGSGYAGRERNLLAGAYSGMVDLCGLQTYDLNTTHFSALKAYDVARAFLPTNTILCAGLEAPAEGGGSTMTLQATDATCSAGNANTWIPIDQYGAAVGKPYSAQTIAGWVASNSGTNAKDGVIMWVAKRPGVNAIARSAASALSLISDNVTSLE